MWFRQDLRSFDHAALCFAAEAGAVVPVYIFDPADWARAEASARQFHFICESIEDLRSQLGVPVLSRLGPTQEVLARLCTRYAITQIVTEAPPPAAIADWAAATGIAWCCVPQPLTGEPLAAPALNCPPDLVANPLPLAPMLRLGADACAHRQRGGSTQAMDLLDTFLTSRGESYHRAQSQPLASERAASRLSPHLTHGTISLRSISAAITARLAERPTGRWPSALHGFQAQLSRRPDPQATCLPQGCLASDPRLEFWLAGETGLPFVDALMRYLAATGWLNAHLRGLVLSLAVHQLGLDWQAASAALARRLTDYDPAIFWPQAKKLAGQTDETPRLFNPIKQGFDLDPNGSFTRRWLPELACLPDSCLQTPWKWAGAARLLGSRYPEPLVDIATAHRTAREAIWARYGRPLRSVPRSAPLLIETPQPQHGQLRLEF